MLITSVDSRPSNRQKSTIVTVNGWTCKGKDWKCLEPLSESGFGLFRFERAGYTHNYFKSLASEILGELVARGIGHPHLMVHSMGGLVAIAYLNLVMEQRYEKLRPSMVTFVTPVIDDPRVTFPQSDRLISLGSCFTRWRANRIVEAIDNEDQSHRHMWLTLTAFQIASPILFSHMGAPIEVKREFARFLKEAKAHERLTTRMELYAMCKEGGELGNMLTKKDIWIPPKIVVVGGQHDLFIDNVTVAMRIFRVLGDHADVKIKILEECGHFPAQERPDLFRETIEL